ncbi:ABC transporter permease [Natronolimnobius baerhuensis]|uniref:ABC transporter permease n=1 Tax=Natronolimnobius baerhuensis TaxID=253108 RepID=A0A202E487_9EURY|nr:ABC transporter permease [Natronolimnobius baerhuensis]OVE83014.1 ABC transporter permease [Natronolimnobius baerhuensis]
MSEETSKSGGGGGGSPATARGPSSILGRITARREAGVLFGFIVLYGIIAVSRPDIFFSWGDISGVTFRLFRTASIYIIIGIGMSFLIISGEFDLSVGSMFAVGGLSFAMLIQDFQLTVFAAMVVVLLIAAGVGVTNGVIVTKIGVPSLIATIGMLSVLRGIALSITDGSWGVPRDNAAISLLGGTTDIFGVSVAHQVFWAILLVIAFGFVLHQTRFGYHIYAVGDDQDAAEKTGINADRVKILNFVIVAMLAAFAGMISISYYGSMFASSGATYELLIIAAVVIGGTNLFGGEGTLSGMVLGALVIAIIPQVLVLNGMSVDIQELLTGVIIIVAVVLDIIFRGR